MRTKFTVMVQNCYEYWTKTNALMASELVPEKRFRAFLLNGANTLYFGTSEGYGATEEAAIADLKKEISKKLEGYFCAKITVIEIDFPCS